MISIISITLIFTLINRWVTPRPPQTWSNSARTAIFTRETSTQPGGKNGDQFAVKNEEDWETMMIIDDAQVKLKPIVQRATKPSAYPGFVFFFSPT